MGGYDRSDLEIERERAERLRLEREVETMQTQVKDLRDEITTSLKSATEGIRSTFSSEARSAELWCEGGTVQGGPGGVQSGELQSIHAELTGLLTDGEEALRQLLLCFSRKGDRMADELAHRLVAVRTLMTKHQGECSHWFARDVCQWQRDVERASLLHDGENYLKAAELLDDIEASIQGRREEAVELAKQQQSRTYLLKAVRQVCCNMGMRELEAPRLERTDDPQSRILLIVASPDNGKLRLALSLDGIQSVGEARDCKRDLRQFSELLSDGFDIRTRFRGVIDDDPKLSTPGRRAEPRAVDQAGHGRG